MKLHLAASTSSLMKTALVSFSCLVSVAPLASCARQGSAVSAGSVRTQAPTGSINLAAAMSDDEILRVFGLDPAKVSAHVTQGKDGQSIAYSAGADRVVITRSIVSGLSVMRGAQSWYLGKS